MNRSHDSRLLLPLAAVLTAILLGGCGRASNPVVVAPTPVRVTAATTGPGAQPLEVTGVVAARDEMKLSFKVGGVVRRVAVREGDTVRAGQVLAELDPTEVGAQLEQAEQLATKAERDRQRGEALYADQVIPLEQLQNLRTQAEVAAAQLRAARFNHQFATIVAPTSGVVLRRLVEERELAAPGQVVLVVGRTDSGYVVRFAVSDRDMVRLKRGATLDLRIDAWPGEAFGAEVRQIANAADPETGLFQIEAAITPGPHALASGLVGRVRLQTSEAGTALTYVPIGAVLEGDGDRARVYIVDGDVARSREVRVAFITANQVALRSGVNPGERVVSTGAPYLLEGGRVAVAQ